MKICFGFVFLRRLGVALKSRGLWEAAEVAFKNVLQLIEEGDKDWETIKKDIEDCRIAFEQQVEKGDDAGTGKKLIFVLPFLYFFSFLFFAVSFFFLFFFFVSFAVSFFFVSSIVALF